MESLEPSAESTAPLSAESAESPVHTIAPTEPIVADGEEEMVLGHATPRDMRQVWSERIRGEHRLPGALRDRLAAAVELAQLADGLDEPRLSVSQVASLFAETIPSLVGVERTLVPALHPTGDGFFQQGPLSDDDAARLAHQQLARTGFSRER